MLALLLVLLCTPGWLHQVIPIILGSDRGGPTRAEGGVPTTVAIRAPGLVYSPFDSRINQHIPLCLMVPIIAQMRISSGLTKLRIIAFSGGGLNGWTPFTPDLLLAHRPRSAARPRGPPARAGARRRRATACMPQATF